MQNHVFFSINDINRRTFEQLAGYACCLLIPGFHAILEPFHCLAEIFSDAANLLRSKNRKNN